MSLNRLLNAISTNLGLLSGFPYWYTFKTHHHFKSFTVRRAGYSGVADPCHVCWCSGVLRLQVISSRGIGYIRYRSFTSTRIDLTACAIPVWIKDMYKCKYIHRVNNAWFHPKAEPRQIPFMSVHILVHCNHRSRDHPAYQWHEGYSAYVLPALDLVLLVTTWLFSIALRLHQSVR